MTTRRLTVRVADVRAVTNRMLALSADEPGMDRVREGICAVYERIAMAANDYRGYNLLPATTDSQWRRWYYGDMTPGDDTDAANAAMQKYRNAESVVTRFTDGIASYGL